MKNQEILHEVFDIFLSNLCQILYTILNFSNNKSDNQNFDMQNIQSLIQNNSELFVKVCSIWRSTSALKETLANEDKSMNNFNNPREKKIKKFKKSYKSLASLKKLKEAKKQVFKNQNQKIFLRLLPKSKKTHQIMMKMNNFPRLELK